MLDSSLDKPSLSTLAFYSSLWPLEKMIVHFGRLFTNIKKWFLFQRAYIGQDNGNKK